MTPEEQARQSIDRQLDACGWVVQDRKAMNIYAALGVAIREFPLDVGETDYLLYADGKVIGVVEAKPTDHGTLTGVESQSIKYVTSLPSGVPSHKLPVPFHYESTGTVTQFTNLLDPSPRSRMVFAFHRPEESRPSSGSTRCSGASRISTRRTRRGRCTNPSPAS